MVEVGHPGGNGALAPIGAGAAPDPASGSSGGREVVRQTVAIGAEASHAVGAGNGDGAETGDGAGARARR